MKKIKRTLFGLFLLGCAAAAQAEGGGSSAGLTLQRVTGARISGLGNAGVSIRNDVTAMGFNPASVGSLKSGQVSLFHEQGVSDDSFNQVALGAKLWKGGLGLSAGRYDAGKFEAFDGVNSRSVSAQEDMVINLAYGFSFRGMEFGGGVKYLSSQLAETAKGTATGFDLGANIPLASHLRAGVSIPVYQSQINYGGSDEKISKIARMGLSYDTTLNLRAPMPLLLLAEVPYYVNEKEYQTSLGVETHVSILSFRMGYIFKSDFDEFSLGTGFVFRNVGLDYSFGLVQNDLDSVHKVSLSMKFGESATPVQWPKNSD